ncbi:hypothetical protein OIU77_014409, partial [Salix suchowensis]
MVVLLSISCGSSSNIAPSRSFCEKSKTMLLIVELITLSRHKTRTWQP